MTYCANCGSQVDGKFCPKCGSAVGAAATGGSTGGSAPGAPVPAVPVAQNPGLGFGGNLGGAPFHIPVVGLIFLLVEPLKKNKAIRFQSQQSLFYCIAW